MSFAYLLDTSVLSQPLKDQPLRGVQRRWTPERSPGLCTSSICQAELLRGLEGRQSEKLWRRYRDYLAGEVTVVPFDEHAAVTYSRLCARLQAAGTRRDMADLLIAAAAIAADLTLATLNVRHFDDLGGLRVEDWTN